ncbi:LysR family transcriptional regulator [Thalassospira sp. MA62]|nr:LysR family transcriptional regulator [Thalassospira sp. MA62]
MSHIRAFETAARHQNFVRAADELGITPTAVSQHVRALEDWLGVALFERQARGVRLTDKGDVFAQSCSRAIIDIANAAADISRKDTKRKISLACQPSIVSLWLAPRLPDFIDQHPDIQVSIVYPMGARHPDEVGADLLIQYGYKAPATGEKFLNAATRPTCAPSYCDRVGTLETPASLMNAHLLHDETESAWHQWFAAHDLVLASGNAPVFADFNLLVSSVLAGHGIGLCPTALIESDIAAGNLIVLSEDAINQDKFYWLIAADNPSPDVQLLHNWLMKQALSSISTT